MIDREDFLTREEYNKSLSILKKLDDLQDLLIESILNRDIYKRYIEKKNYSGSYYKNYELRENEGELYIHCNTFNSYDNGRKSIPLEYIAKLKDIKIKVSDIEYENNCIYLEYRSEYNDLYCFINNNINGIKKALKIKKEYKNRIIDINKFDYRSEYSDLYELIDDILQ